MNRQQIADGVLGVLGGQYGGQVELAFSDLEIRKELAAAQLRTELKAATRTDDCLEVYDKATSNFEQVQAFAKAFSLATTTGELRRCFLRTKSHTREAYMCIHAIAALLAKEDKN